ncbi:MAG: chromate transporter, partial [Pseudomonadota bacterium]
HDRHGGRGLRARPRPGAGQGGWATAFVAGALALWMTFLPCFLWIFALAPYLDRMMNVPRLAQALSCVSAAIVGVIANLSVWFALHVYFGQTFDVGFANAQLTLPLVTSVLWFPIGIAVICAPLLSRSILPLPALLGAAAGLGALGSGVLT